MTPRVQPKMSRCLEGTTSRELRWPMRTTHRRNNFKKKHQKSTKNTSNKKYAAEQAAKELGLNPRVLVPQLSERSSTCQQEGQRTYGHRMVIQIKRYEPDGRQKIHSPERSAIRQNSQTRHVAICTPSITNVTETLTTSTTRTDVTHDESIYFSAKSDGHRFRGPIHRRPRHSCDQSSVNDNAEGPNSENDNASEIYDTITSPSTIYSPVGTQNVDWSHNEENSKTLVENTDTKASSKDSLVVMAGSSRFDSSSNKKMSSILCRRPLRHEQTSERPRGNTDSEDGPTPKDVQAPFSRHEGEVVVTPKAHLVSPATMQRRKRAQLLRDAMNHLKGFVEKFETVIEMADADQVI